MVLVNEGADPKMRNKKGFTAFEVALRASYSRAAVVDIADLLASPDERPEVEKIRQTRSAAFEAAPVRMQGEYQICQDPNAPRPMQEAYPHADTASVMSDPDATAAPPPPTPRAQETSNVTSHRPALVNRHAF